MNCRQCHGNNGLLIRGLCSLCAPNLHAQYSRRFDLMGEIETMFKDATGKTALEDWHSFEQFLENDLPVAKQRQFISTFKAE